MSSLVGWLNGTESVFETTESFFVGPGGHQSMDFEQFEIMCSGRLVLFCRHYEFQIRRASWIMSHVKRALNNYVPDAPNACIGLFKCATQFAALSDDGGQTAPFGDALGLRLFGFGNSSQETFDGFGSAIAGAFAAMREVNEMIIEGYRLKP
jgi:hypothetical protein